MKSRGSSESARDKLLDAAVTLIRRNGFAATSVDQLCAAAGLTKGGFFHHFASKEALGVAAAGHWLEITTPLFAEADYHGAPDALARVLGYLDLRETLIEGGTDAFTCLAGTLAQEVHQSHPAIARAAEAAIAGHARTLEADIAEALVDQGVAGSGAVLAGTALATEAEDVTILGSGGNADVEGFAFGQCQAAGGAGGGVDEADGQRILHVSA